VSPVRVAAWGGGGGTGDSGNGPVSPGTFVGSGGEGGFVTATVFVAAGDTLTIDVAAGGSGGGGLGGSTTVTDQAGLFTLAAPGGTGGTVPAGSVAAGVGGAAGTATSSVGAGAVSNFDGQAGVNGIALGLDGPTSGPGAGLPGASGGSNPADLGGNGEVIVTDL
jgi:hypothetical protein